MGQSPDTGMSSRIGRRAGQAVEQFGQVLRKAPPRRTIRRTDEQIRLARRHSAAAQIEFQPKAIEETPRIANAPGIEQRGAARPCLPGLSGGRQPFGEATGQLGTAPILDGQIDEHIEAALARAERHFKAEEPRLLRVEGGQHIERAGLAASVAQGLREGGKQDVPRHLGKAVPRGMGWSSEGGGNHAACS